MVAAVVFLACMLAVGAQAAQVEGRVTDAITGASVVGALVRIEGTALKAQTDAEGWFRIDGVPDVRLRVSVTARGYERVELRRTPGEALAVGLQPQIRFEKAVVVTETRAREGETPVAFTNLDAEDIADRHWAQDPPMLLAETPNVYAYSDAGNGIGYSYMRIRGFDQRRIAVSINGVPLNDPESHEVWWIDLPDLPANLQDIQIQRGVGNSLYGSAPIGGSVNLETAHLSAEPELTLTLGLGSYDTEKRSLAYQSGILADSWAMYGRYSWIHSDGYRDQSWTKTWSYFFGLEHFGPRMTTRINAYGGPEQMHLAYYGVSRDYLEGRITGDRERDRRYNPLQWHGETDNFNQPHYELINEWELRPGLVWKNTLYLTRGEGFYDQYKEDADYESYWLEPFQLPDGTEVSSTDLVRRRWITESQSGITSRAIWEAGSSSLTAGINVRLHQARHVGRVKWAEVLPPGVGPDHTYYDYEVEKRAWSVYLHEVYRLGERWSVMLDGQYARRKYHIFRDRMNGVDLELTFDWFTPRAGVNFAATDHLSFFVNVSQAKREPALRDIYDPQDRWSAPAFREWDIETNTFRGLLLHEESMIDYELGASWSSPRLAVVLNGYWMDFDNEIVYAGTLDDSGVPVNGNAARSYHRGVELSVEARPGGGFHLAANASFSDDKFREYEEYAWDGGINDYSGNRIAGFPEYLANIRLAREWRGFEAFLSARFVGRLYLDNTENDRKFPERRREPGYEDKTIEPYQVLDAGVGYSFGRVLGIENLRFSVRVHNLLDEEYETFGYVDWDGSPRWIPAATRNYYAALELSL
jgi:iron complex outermembrane receptor protein